MEDWDSVQRAVEDLVVEVNPEAARAAVRAAERAAARAVEREIKMAAKVVCLKAVEKALAMEKERRGGEKVEKVVPAEKVVAADAASKGRVALPLPSCPMNCSAMR